MNERRLFPGLPSIPNYTLEIFPSYCENIIYNANGSEKYKSVKGNGDNKETDAKITDNISDTEEKLSNNIL